MESIIRIARQTIARMELKPGDRVLDLSCGAGWATRLLAEAVAGRAGNGRGPGYLGGDDCAGQRAARATWKMFFSRLLPPMRFHGGTNISSSALSIESFYYYPDQDAVLRELYRVLVPGGGLLF